MKDRPLECDNYGKRVKHRDGNSNIAMEYSPLIIALSEFTYSNRYFSTAMLVYHRGIHPSCPEPPLGMVGILVHHDLSLFYHGLSNQKHGDDLQIVYDTGFTKGKIHSPKRLISWDIPCDEEQDIIFRNLGLGVEWDGI